MVICFVTVPQVSVKNDAWAMFTTPVCQPVTPLTGEIVSGVKPLGPEMVHVARGVVIFHVNGTEVAVLLRTRVGFEEKVTIEMGADTTQLPPLSTYPALQAVQEPAAPLPFGQVGAQLPPLST